MPEQTRLRLFAAMVYKAHPEYWPNDSYIRPEDAEHFVWRPYTSSPADSRCNVPQLPGAEWELVLAHSELGITNLRFHLHKPTENPREAFEAEWKAIRASLPR